MSDALEMTAHSCKPFNLASFEVSSPPSVKLFDEILSVFIKIETARVGDGNQLRHGVASVLGERLGIRLQPIENSPFLSV